MAKPAVQYACTECGYSAGRWFGKCPGCDAFGTLVEEVVGQVTRAAAPPKPLLRLVDVDAEAGPLIGPHRAVADLRAAREYLLRTLTEQARLLDAEV